MKKHRFLFEKNLMSEHLDSDDKELINQLLNVLRLKVGETVLLFDGAGSEISAKIISLDRQKVVFGKIEKVAKVSKEGRDVTLYCSILKKENFEIVVQKATEIGVNKIVPIITSRTVKFGFKEDRLLKIIKEACEQCGRASQPKIESPLKFEEAINEAKKTNKINIIFDQSGEKIGKLKSDKIAIFIGPEGGWTKEELIMAKKDGFVIGLLGNLTLRAETAGIVGSYEAINGF